MREPTDGTSRPRRRRTARKEAAAWTALLLLTGCVTPSDRVFYCPRDVGSESMFDPLQSSLQYVLDSAQVEGFGAEDLDDKLEIVWDHLRDPIGTIEDGEDGWRGFVNREIAPIDPENLRDSVAILPNVTLHLFGGGLVYRKNAEWLEAHGFPAPYVTSASLAMVAEVLAEAVEKPTTDPTDEIADILIYRPLGIWLFSDDDRARWIRDELDPVDWPYLLMWDVHDGEFANIGMNYVVRPSWLGATAPRAFAHLGMTNLFGLSHDIGGDDALSWGLGAATVTTKPVELRWSAGAFYDRDNSLFASLIVHGAEGYAVRTNVYPGVLLGAGVPLGVFFGVEDDGDVTAGLHYEIPIGIAR